MKYLSVIAVLFSSLSAHAMSCHVETDYIHTIYKEVSGVCDHGYEFKIEGPALGLKFEKTDFFGIACIQDKKIGQYIGIGFDIGLAKGFTGAAFMVPKSAYDLGPAQICFVGGLEDPAFFYVGFSITRLTISAPTPASIEWAHHMGLK